MAFARSTLPWLSLLRCCALLVVRRDPEQAEMVTAAPRRPRGTSSRTSPSRRCRSRRRRWDGHRVERHHRRQRRVHDERRHRRHVTTGEPETGDSTSEWDDCGRHFGRQHDGSRPRTPASTSYDIGWCILQFPGGWSPRTSPRPVRGVHPRVRGGAHRPDRGATTPTRCSWSRSGTATTAAIRPMGDRSGRTSDATAQSTATGVGSPDYSEVNDEYQGNLSRSAPLGSTTSRGASRATAAKRGSGATSMA